MTALWMFTGQGSLTPGAARGLYAANAEFRAALDRYGEMIDGAIDGQVNGQLDVPLARLLLSTDTELTALVQETQYAQPAITALQLAQVAMWEGRGMRPAAVVGHSVGELAAAVVAGVLTAEQALEVAVVRGRLMAGCERGGMAAVMAGVEEVERRLPAGLVVAAENGRAMTVVAGAHELLTEFLGGLELAHTRLAVSHAFHSPMMAPAVAGLAQHLEGMRFGEGNEVRFYSTASGRQEQERLRSGAYWAEQLAGRVRFVAAVEAAWAAERPATVVEVGPGSTLLAMAKRLWTGPAPRWIASSEAATATATTALATPAASAAPAAPRTARGSGLFRHVPLGWAKPSARKSTQSMSSMSSAPSATELGAPAMPATPASCVYEKVWTPPQAAAAAAPMSAVAAASAASGAQLDHLLISRTALAAEVIAGLPAGWQTRIAQDAGELAALPAPAGQRWNTVALHSAGAEADVALGLALLQQVSSGAVAAERVVLLTAAGQAGDAGLWGLARTSRLERPELRVRSVAYAAGQLAPALELAARDAQPAGLDDELLVNGEGGVRVPRLRRCSELGEGEGLTLPAEATYVISGGRGALGQVAAKLLLARGAQRVVLLSRTASAVGAVSAAGGNVDVEVTDAGNGAQVVELRCDVAQAASVEAVRAWLSQRGWPPVRGVIHAAGVLSDATLPNQTASKLREAYAAKVDGAVHLRAGLAPKDFLVLYSSVAALLGSVGQGSYAAANATLDALAEQWSAAGEAVLSVQWGAWSQGGMAARQDAVKRVEASGFGSLSDELGGAVLEQLLAAGVRGVVCVSPIDWSRLSLELPLLSRLRTRSAAGPDATDATGAAPAVELLDTVRQIVAEAVGRPLQDDASLLDNGLDSLGSVSLRNRLATRLRVELSAAFVFDCPSIAAMVRHLSSLTPRASPTSAAARPPSPAVAASALPVLVIGAGIGGLGFARQLEKAGTSVVVMDAAERVGGVWQTLANASSKLQIDSPAYDFDSTALPAAGDHRWRASFPSQHDILAGCRSTAEGLLGPVHLGARVQRIRALERGEYEVTYQRDGRVQRMRVSGVAAMTGGLHRPRRCDFPGEARFAGHKGLGVADDTPLQRFRDANVVIVGHGAFAVENMRTALENGARHVTLVCRRQHLVLSTFCNWLLNSTRGVMSVSDVVEVMRPFYAACGVEIETLRSLVRDAAGEWMLDQATVPPGSDLYFLAQVLGKLTVVTGEVAELTEGSVVLGDGRELAADVFLKCLGSTTDPSVLFELFGEGSDLQGLWINGDPNLITYNDGAQAPRKVKSLMCASYAFFVQAFAPAFLHFRAHPQEHARALARITAKTATSTEAERVLVELWDFLEPLKRVVAERTAELLPFDRFQVEREAEWTRYARLLRADVPDVDDAPNSGDSSDSTSELWSLLGPALTLVHRRNPQVPVEQRGIYSSLGPSLGALSVFAPRRPRVLFLPGQGTNARLARTLLERTGWLDRAHLDFVVPDAPYEMPAFTNDQQLEQVGLSGLVSLGLYDKTARYREWRAGFEALYQRHHEGKPVEVTDADRQQWCVTLDYVRELARRHGPFDGIAGFCEGAAVASVALHLQARGQDLGLGSVRFFIAMAPWRSPVHEHDGMFQSAPPLRLPMLQIVGDNDMDVFLGAAPHFHRDFAGAVEFRHNGQHVYPPLSPGLEAKLRQLVDSSGAAASWLA